MYKRKILGTIYHQNNLSLQLLLEAMVSKSYGYEFLNIMQNKIK
jgi:hypothetical protein